MCITLYAVKSLTFKKPWDIIMFKFPMTYSEIVEGI